MKKVRTIAIYPNYDTSKDPIGYMEISEEVSEEVLRDCAIIPMVTKLDGLEVIVQSFGMVDRTTVDTRPWSELGL